MKRMTSEELQAVYDSQNSRVGMRLEDKQGRSYFITDVTPEGRFRVISERGEAFLWHEDSQSAEPIRKPKRVHTLVSR